jgi:hypothetical protein
MRVLDKIMQSGYRFITIVISNERPLWMSEEQTKAEEKAMTGVHVAIDVQVRNDEIIKNR